MAAVTPEVATRGTHLDGHSAVVTGGAHGIGRAIAVALASAGAAVSILDLDPAAETVGLIGSSAAAYTCDITDPAKVSETLEVIEATCGIPDILVNVAGVSPGRRQSFLDTSREHWETSLAVNASGMFHVSQRFARMLVGGSRPGRIVNILSTASMQGFAGMSAYCASKGAALLLTRAMAVDLAPHDITVNGVAPGSIRTRMSEVFRRENSPEVVEAISKHDRERILLGRVGEPEDIAAATLFLASPAAEWITGTVITVDGGFMANGGPPFTEDGALATRW
jgi:2-deoxy-D-gluconate 3-dehydrogenase